MTQEGQDTGEVTPRLLSHFILAGLLRNAGLFRIGMLAAFPSERWPFSSEIRIPENIQEQYADIPWYQMKGMRNILIHEYFGVDIDVLWRTVKEDLPLLKIKIQKVI